MKKIIDIEERIPSMREKRRRRTNRKFIFVMTIFVLALLILLYFQSSLSRIDRIIVKGASLYEDDYYIENTSLALDEPVWGFRVKRIEKELQKIDSVAHVSVSRKWLRNIEIDIQEWGPIAYIQEDNQYGLLLESGEVFLQGQGQQPEEDAPILNGFTDSAIKKRMIAQLIKMESGVYQLISEIIYDEKSRDPNQITVYMDDGYEIRAIIPTFAEKMTYYTEIIAQLQDVEEKGVIDMEVGTYFTPFSQLYGQEVEIEGEVRKDEEGD